MEKKYLFLCQVYIGQKPQERRHEFSADDDRDALARAGEIINDIGKEMPFAPPRVHATVYRLEMLLEWEPKWAPVPNKQL